MSSYRSGKANENDLNMSFYLHPEFLEMLDYGAVYRTSKIGVLVRNNAGLVADAIVDILSKEIVQHIE